LEYASEELKNDQVIVLAAVANHGIALQFALNECKNDQEVALAAVNNDGFALLFVSDELRNNSKCFLAAVNRNGYALQCASEELKNDQEIVLAAVTSNSSVLEYASDERKNDQEIVLAAVRSDGLALEWASDERKNDREVALAAIKNNLYAFEYSSEGLRGDINVITAALYEVSNDMYREGGGQIIEWISADIKEKLRAVHSMRRNPRGLLYSLDDPTALEDFISTEVATEIYRCRFLRAIQIHHLPPDAMNLIVAFEDVEERLRELRQVEEVLPIISTYCYVSAIDDNLDSFLEMLTRHI
jgi:hypothetical protein